MILLDGPKEGLDTNFEGDTFLVVFSVEDYWSKVNPKADADSILRIYNLFKVPTVLPNDAFLVAVYAKCSDVFQWTPDPRDNWASGRDLNQELKHAIETAVYSFFGDPQDRLGPRVGDISNSGVLRRPPTG